MDLKVFVKIRSSVDSKYCFSQENLKSFVRSRMGKRAKFIDPILQEANSGLKVDTTATLCSGVMLNPPPVVVQMIMSHLLFTLLRTVLKRSRLGEGCPVSGFRT